MRHMPLNFSRPQGKSYLLFVCVLQACFPNNLCSPCADLILDHVGQVLRFVGTVGLFFSFTEVRFTIHYELFLEHCSLGLCRTLE